MAGPRTLDKRALERLEDERLLPLAARSARARRAHPSFHEGRLHHYRTEFQRDRDRILHSRAFRRLKDKTQVLGPGQGDHHRTRLTHALEAAQVARTVARVLRLNEDLAEAVALGLNLGAPPFGASGAEVLDELLRTGDADGPTFDQAGQALRVVDLLERRYAHPGLNLCHEVREGLAKSAGGTLPRDPELDCRELWPDQAASPEAQLAHAADRLAALVHDIEDGLRAGIVVPRRLERLGAVREVSRFLGSQLAPPRESFLRGNQLLRGMLHLFVVGLVEGTAAHIEDWCQRHDVRGFEEFLARRETLPRDLVALPPATAELAEEAGSFVATSLHNSAAVRRSAYRAARLLRFLRDGYTSDPLTLPDHALLAFRSRVRTRFLRDVPPEELASEIDRRYGQSPAFRRFLADFLAGMSDRFAAEEAARLGGPDLRQVTS